MARRPTPDSARSVRHGRVLALVVRADLGDTEGVMYEDRAFTGDDDRQDERDDERCPICHADPMEDCRDGCDCAWCLAHPRTVAVLTRAERRP